ncbi:hypothetical protein [Azospirillum endophyticum]
MMPPRKPEQPTEEPKQAQIYGPVEKGFSARFISDFARQGNSQPGQQIENPAGAAGGAFSPSIDSDNALHLRLSANGVRKVEATYDPGRFYISPADLTAGPYSEVLFREEGGLGITTLFKSELALVMNQRLFTIFPYLSGSRPGHVIVPPPRDIWPADWLKLRITGANGDVIHCRKTASNGGDGEFVIEKIDRWSW